MDCTLSGLLPAIFTTIIICLLISHYNRPRPTLAATLPWADLRDEYFAKTRASLRHLTNSSQILRDGYEKYGKHNQPFFVSDASFQPQIMLPQSYITWLATRSETILSIWPVRTKRRAMEAMIDSVDHKGTVAFMDKVVSRFLTRNLGTAQGECADEIAKSVDDAMGVETNVWRDVNMVDMFKEVGDRSGVRALFGKTLCRDREFLRVLGRYKTLMGFGIFFNGQLPPGVRQVVALLLAIPFRVCKGRVKKVLVPIVEERMREAMRGTDDVAGEEGGQNLLTQCVRTVLKEKSNVQRSSPDYIADQFLVLSFASLASIALVAGNLFLDILSTPNALERLRSEAANVLKSTEDLANPAALKKLVLMDSAIRESLRRSSIQTRGLLREVVATDGVDLPNGTHVDRGTWVGVPVEAVHMSEEFYEKSDSYDPFRFAKINEGSEAQLEASDVTNEFLAWSHGTHPCPGRWFAIQNLKLMIAYIALNYEVEPIVDRPPSIVVGDANLPNFSFCIRVRRIKRV